MAESSLSISFTDLKEEVGHFLGYGRNVSPSWTATQLAEIVDAVQSGVRRVYYPVAINENFCGHEWSWLRPTAPISIVSGDGDYDLPDDFGRLIGAIHYPASEYRDSIGTVSVGKLLNYRAVSNLTGAPYVAAIRYKSSTGTIGQRQEILFFPTPDASWTLLYEYEAYTGVLSDTYPYPLGGMQLAELYIESCLAVAESRINDNPGNHTQQYQALLVDAIMRDRKRGPKIYGKMGSSESNKEEFKRGYSGSVYPITYKGEVI